ncbi:MAG: beta-N-acetylglucosaminidase domain-containing protein [Porphyromonas sp.]|nr:beta-N-acetylglucosaminidase domain-containing protein [Porphyromonas sp.]
MKRVTRTLLLLPFLLLACSLSVATAALSSIPLSPVVQHAEWGDRVINRPISYRLVASPEADRDALTKLHANITASSKKSATPLYIGQVGDASLEDLKLNGQVPVQSEGYYLEVTPERVVVLGRDGVGTFYGVQTLLQILRHDSYPEVRIQDYPSIATRGMIEGFYGNPYSHQNRLDLFEFFGENKMNCYIYGPKNDPYHGFGDKWRLPYPEQEAEGIRELVQVAHENKVNFVWALHPGNYIKWTDDDGDGVIDDFIKAKEKFEMMYGLGVRAFAVFFDDIWGVGKDPEYQAQLMNYLTEEFVLPKGDVEPLLLCPTQYNKAFANGSYLPTLGERLHESVQVMWTGATVVDMINREDMEWINQQLGRKAFIWLNYPVTDYCVDHLLMGATYGNDTDIADLYGGFCANPMEYAEASKVSLFSIGDYTWNTPAYDALDSWERGLHYLMPEEAMYEAFKLFCENNIDLGPTGHTLRRTNESSTFKAAAEPFLNWTREGVYDAEGAQGVRDYFQRICTEMPLLAQEADNQALIEEIQPWMDAFVLMAERGEALIDAYDALHKGDAEAFVRHYQQVKELEQQKMQIRSRDFEGSIKNPRPMPANEVIAPFLKELESLLVAEYQSRYDYRHDLFPQLVVESGFYFIMVDGQYLSGIRGDKTPILREERDLINPQRQVWEIELDTTQSRYSIRNAEDNRYINELGIFGRYPYQPNWHTFTIAEQEGKYAIRNGGDADDQIWAVQEGKLVKSDHEELADGDYLFELIPVENEQ